MIIKISGQKYKKKLRISVPEQKSPNVFRIKGLFFVSVIPYNNLWLSADWLIFSVFI